MKTEKEIRERIRKFEIDNSHALKGGVATVEINAPLALMQISAEQTLAALYWTLGEQYKSKLKARPLTMR